uniref:Uncharacterized protein n=1 Tax=Anguilla anguilla TaxID=7936 RepID=A0A0E9PFF5_ANGAN
MFQYIQKLRTEGPPGVGTFRSART